MLKAFVIALPIIIAVLLVMIAMQPVDFKLSRSILSSAPPSALFSQVNDFHRWEGWSPWAKMDPNMKVTYQGPPTGEGASYGWTGNNKVGEGRMTILKSQPSDLVQIQLDFLKPMKAVNVAEFTFRPEGQNTRVTWTMTGKKNFMAKAFHFFVNMEKMIGPYFEQGLAQMKSNAEGAGK